MIELYRGQRAMLDNVQVQITYETCDGSNNPRYKIANDDRWYKGTSYTQGYDHCLELSLLF